MYLDRDAFSNYLDLPLSNPEYMYNIATSSFVFLRVFSRENKTNSFPRYLVMT